MNPYDYALKEHLYLFLLFKSVSIFFQNYFH